MRKHLRTLLTCSLSGEGKGVAQRVDLFLIFLGRASLLISIVPGLLAGLRVVLQSRSEKKQHGVGIKNRHIDQWKRTEAWV